MFGGSTSVDTFDMLDRSHASTDFPDFPQLHTGIMSITILVSCESQARPVDPADVPTYFQLSSPLP